MRGKERGSCHGIIHSQALPSSDDLTSFTQFSMSKRLNHCSRGEPGDEAAIMAACYT